jgi:elongation factor Ts
MQSGRPQISGQAESLFTKHERQAAQESTVDINPKDVMALRAKTGLGMMDCKAALIECNGDMAKAEAFLREKLKGKMDARTDRVAGQGCIAIAVEGTKASIVEIRSETDFTARNDLFRAMAQAVAKLGLSQPAGPVTATPEITKKIDDVRITTNENVSLARGERLDGGSFGQYVHHDGKQAALVQFSGEVAADVAKGICQHVVAHQPTPMAVNEAGMPAQLVAETKANAVAEAQASGKPPQIADKIAEGKMRKFFEENTLIGQKYVADDKKSIKDLLPAGVTITKFVRYVVGGG